MPRGVPHLKVVDKAVILVDDGISTFSDFRMAVTVLRLRRAAQIVIAVPIAGAAPMLELAATVNDVVTCTVRTIPGELDAVGQWLGQLDRKTVHRSEDKILVMS